MQGNTVYVALDPARTHADDCVMVERRHSLAFLKPDDARFKSCQIRELRCRQLPF